MFSKCLLKWMHKENNLVGNKDLCNFWSLVILYQVISLFSEIWIYMPKCWFLLLLLWLQIIIRSFRIQLSRKIATSFNFENQIHWLFYKLEYLFNYNRFTRKMHSFFKLQIKCHFNHIFFNHSKQNCSVSYSP